MTSFRASICGVSFPRSAGGDGAAFEQAVQIVATVQIPVQVVDGILQDHLDEVQADNASAYFEPGFPRVVAFVREWNSKAVQEALQPEDVRFDALVSRALQSWTGRVS